MKRIALVAGLALTMLSCAQHDSKSPDTSGIDPQSPNDSSSIGTGGGTMNGGQTNTGGTNANNDGMNNNQMINTGDSSLNKKQKQ